MLEILIKYLNDYLAASLPNSVTNHGLAHRLRRTTDGNVIQEYPALYCGNDEYKNVELDTAYTYIRQRAAITDTINENDGVSGCDELVTRTYPITLVAKLPKSIYDSDNAYIDAKLAGNIANTLISLNWSSVINSLGLSDARLLVRNQDTDRYSVWNKEYRGAPMAVRFTDVFIAIDIDIVVNVTDSCLRNFVCDDEVIAPSPCASLKSTAVLRDTEGNVISVTVIPAGEKADITAPDGVVENSDATFTDTVLSGGTLVLPDEQYEVYVDGVLEDSGSFPIYGNKVININL